MPRVVEINCVEHLQQYRLAWFDFSRRTRRPSFAQTLDWFDAYFRGDENVLRPRVLIVADDDEHLIGILPLAVREEATKVGPLRVLGYPLGLGLGRCGPVGNLPTVTLLEGLRHIADSFRDWDLIDLRGIETDVVDDRRTITALNHAGLEATLEPWEDRAVVEFGASWDDYVRTRDPARRDRIEQVEQKLTRRAAVSHVRYRPEGTMHGDDDPRWDLYADCLTIARQSRPGTTPDGLTPSTPDTVEFFRLAHEAAARAGALDLNLLYVNQAPAAFAYNYVAGDCVTNLAIGHSAVFADDDVGPILLARMIRQSHAWGDRTIDLGASRHEWKRDWATRRATTFRAVHYPRRAIKTELLRWGRSLRRTLTRA